MDANKEVVRNLLPKGLYLHARQYGAIVAYDSFAQRIDPTRPWGLQDRWEDFPAFCGENASVTIWKTVTDSQWKRWKNQLKIQAEESAIWTANDILEKANLKAWWVWIAATDLSKLQSLKVQNVLHDSGDDR